MTWDMKALIEFVEIKQGKLQRDLLSSVLDSLMWKLNIACYHADESKEAINRLLGNSAKIDQEEIIDLIFEQVSGSEKGKEFSDMQFASEANLIACAQSLHSMADIFGQTVYISLDLDNVLRKPIPQQHRNISTINKAMEEKAIAPSITKEIDDLLKSQEFCYLKDYVNVTKHRSLIPARYSVSLEKDSSHGLQISTFSYGDRVHDARWSNDFLNNDVIMIQKKIIEAGAMINRYMAIS